MCELFVELMYACMCVCVYEREREGRFDGGISGGVGTRSGVMANMRVFFEC